MSKENRIRIPLKDTAADAFFVRQLDDYSCGPACLATLSNIYESGLSYEECRDYANPDPAVGTDHNLMAFICDQYMPFDSAGEGSYHGGVAIALVTQENEGHYVVFLAQEKDKVVYYDPYHHELVVDSLKDVEWYSLSVGSAAWSANMARLEDNSIQRWLDMAKPRENTPAPAHPPKNPPSAPAP
jgi:hypothetical protein